MSNTQEKPTAAMARFAARIERIEIVFDLYRAISAMRSQQEEK